MDSFITWEGVVATAALAVSLYSLRQVRRAPAMARQRELRDQLRTLLEDYLAQVKVIRDSIRAGGDDLPSAPEFMKPAKKMSELGPRLANNHNGRVGLVVAELFSVGGGLSSLEGARSRNRTKASLESIDFGGHLKGLPPANVDMAMRDLDDACKDAARVIAAEIKELNRLESA